MNYIIVLDYSNDKVVIIIIPDGKKIGDLDEFIYEKLGLRSADCSYLISEKLNISTLLVSSDM